VPIIVAVTRKGREVACSRPAARVCRPDTWDRHRSVPGDREPERGASERTHVQLETDGEQQERQPDHRQHLDRHVGVHDAEDVGAEDDPGQDLHHDSGNPQRRHGGDGQRRQERHQRDDEEVVEPGVRHRVLPS
jgi:hypothetical protein